MRRWLHAVGWLLALLVGLSGCGGASAGSSAEEKGRDALLNRDYETAIRELTRAIRQEPDNAELYYLRGTAYYDRYNTAYTNQDPAADPEDFEMALADFNQAILLAPDYAEAYNYRGLVHAAYDRYDKALADYNRAIQLAPDLATPYYARAYLYETLGDVEQAIADYERFLELNEDTFWEAEAQARLNALRQQVPDAQPPE